MKVTVALKPYLENNCSYFTLVYQNGNLYCYAKSCNLYIE